MKKHSGILLVIGILVIISLITIATGFGYAAARSQHSQEGKCPCDTAIINMANKREISHYYAALYLEREIRLGNNSGNLGFVEACRKWHAEREF